MGKLNYNEKMVLNSSVALCQQVVTIVCGLILPQLILQTFGSATNGLISSVGQFLSIITLLQGGVGTLARIMYYKALASEDNKSVASTFNAITHFFRKFGVVFLLYLLMLAIIYPLISNSSDTYWNISLLVLILGIASIFEYFFGQASQYLLYADQKLYIYSLIQIVCTIISTVLGVFFIKIGLSIYIVKFVSALVFAIRPVVLYLYVKKHYAIDRTIQKCHFNLARRNAAFVRHIAYYIHKSTDIIILTLLMDVTWVSVYAVHNYAVSSLTNIVTSVLGNNEVVFGNMIANKEQDELEEIYPTYDLLSKILSSICFITCMLLINEFVCIYTKNVSDVNYIQVTFARVLVTAEWLYCMVITCQNVYVAAGHLEQTQWIAVGEAIINLLCSVVLVYQWGILGVAVGTLISMIFKTLASIWYVRKNIYDISLVYLFKGYLGNIGSGIAVLYLFNENIKFNISGYGDFFLYAIVIFIVVSLFVLIVNSVLFPEQMKKIFTVFVERIKKRRRN
ncbi:MAG: polysaccharide biosynthesis C-terminal domain-containing protein [Eubacteriales bacterium]